MESPTATAQEKFDLLRVAVEGHVIEAKNAMTGTELQRDISRIIPLPSVSMQP